eukprot:3018022-Rhodomonas_salina.1
MSPKKQNKKTGGCHGAERECGLGGTVTVRDEDGARTQARRGGQEAAPLPASDGASDLIMTQAQWHRGGVPVPRVPVGPGLRLPPTPPGPASSLRVSSPAALLPRLLAASSTPPSHSPSEPPSRQQSLPSPSPSLPDP